MQPLQDQVQALRVLVQSQHRELEALQSLAQAQPLQGLTTDQPWGMGLEGLVLGAAALLLGALSGAVLGRQRPHPAVAPGSAAQVPADFSDSMLYLADEPDRTGAPAAVSAQLHDPHHDAQGATLAHEEGDDALDYDRMALHQQGLSVTAGAGQVDSERVPLDMPAPARAQAPHSAFGAPPSRSEFDRQAAAEEVERVRRSLAQRRADRAKAQTPSPSPASGAAQAVPVAAAPKVAPPEAPMAWDPAPEPAPRVDLDLSEPPWPDAALPALDEIPAASIAWEDLVPGFPEPTSARPAPADAPGQDALAPEIDIDHLEHAGLSEGASLLAGFTDSELAPYADPPAPTPAAAPAPTPAVAPVALDESLLEWVLPEAPVATVEGAVAPAPHAEVPPALPSAEVQLQLAIEFRDLGLWEEARARVLEILEQPDTGVHAQARAMLDELAQTGPAPLGVEPEIKDPWG